MATYALFGKFTAVDGQRDALTQLLLAGREFVAAAGCEAWFVHTSADDPNGVWVYEAWRSEADHDASLNDERIREIISRARPLIASVSDRVKLVPVE